MNANDWSFSGRVTRLYQPSKKSIRIAFWDYQAPARVIIKSFENAIFGPLAKNKFYNQKDRLEINQWLMAQMGYVGPMLGQHHQFHHYNPGKSEFGEARYFKISKRIYQELDERLSVSKFLSGNNYTIADIGTFPWIARHEWHDIGLAKYKNLARWYKEISNRDAVKRGFAFMNKDEFPPEL